MPSRVSLNRPVPIPKETYVSDCVLGAQVLSLNANNEALYRMISGYTSSGIPCAQPGHRHFGGDDGTPINRYIGGYGQIRDSANQYIWKSTATTAHTTSAPKAISDYSHDIWFFVPQGINAVTFDICYILSGTVQIGSGALRVKINGPSYVDASIESGGAGPANPTWDYTSDLPLTLSVKPGERNTLKLYHYTDGSAFGAPQTLTICGFIIKEATTIT